METRRCWFQRQSSDRVGASEVKAGGSSKPANVLLPFWTAFVFPSCGCGVLLLILSVAVPGVA